MEARLDFSVSAPPGYPHRIVTRLVCEVIVDLCLKLAALQNNNLDRAFVLLTILQSSNLPGRHAHLLLDDDLRRPISINAIADSLRMPRETARRHVLALIDSGACVKQSRNGLIVSRDFESSAPMLALYDFAYETFERLMSRCQDLGFNLDVLTTSASGKRPRGRPVASDPRRAVAGLFLEYILKLSLDGLPENRTLLRGLMFCAVMQENIKHITHDRILAWSYSKADQPPPDNLRRPIRIRRLAALLSMPYTTINRNVEAMTAAGVFKKLPEGIIIPQAVMQQVPYLNNGTRMYYWFAVLLQEIRAQGFSLLPPGE